MMSEEESRLEKQLKEFKEAKRKLGELRTLESYTDKEKVAEFDKFYGFAREIINERVKGTDVKDADNWCFEMVLNLLGKKIIWDVYNKLGDL